ncbi:Protein MEI2-like 2 [Symbiodinium microadriaticum]|uniref:Protein MEI2-like 2 n=2 Tax=Symbiodinium TaxID=2949 RepID=A0A1Q9EE63_SYMMI|nr:Protein MEI2-like 2 [Symbiodinium microadriaticum]
MVGSLPAAIFVPFSSSSSHGKRVCLGNGLSKWQPLPWNVFFGSVCAKLASAARWQRAAKAETKPAEKSKYVETVADERLFEQVYLQYTSEYLKGPLYWHPDKLQGWLPDYPGTPMIKEGKYTSHVIGNLKAFSSNELAFLSMLFFGVGLYGNLQFNFYDPQWAKVDAGGFFNVSYIVESFLLPISFFMHIACYIQRQNGKHEAKAQQKAQQHGSFSARQSTERAKMQSLYATLGARRAEAQTSSTHQQERRRSETELKVRQKSQKLESMQSERQQLWQLRKEAQHEARKILRSAKGEVERQAMSSRFSLHWLEQQMARLEQPEALANRMKLTIVVLKGGLTEVLAMTLTMAAMVNLMEIRDDREDDAHNAKPWLAQSIQLITALRRRRASMDATKSLHCSSFLGLSFRPPKSQPRHRREAVAFSRQSSGEAVDVTTMMLRNIPNKYTQNSLLQEINEMGFTGTFDFFYLPMDVHNRSNVGYAFVNFLRNDDAERFRQKFSEHRFQRFQSRKISSVCTAHVQGLHENLRHFQNRAVTHARNDQYRPVVFRNGSRVDLEDVLAEGKTRSPSASNSEEVVDKNHHKGNKVDAKANGKRAANTKSAPKANDRKGERLSQSSASELPLSPPPGLAQSVSAPLESTPGLSSVPELPQAQEQDVMQLLNLRGMLLDRLLQKEGNVQAYNQATLMAMQQMQEQQYMQQMQQTPTMCPMPNPYMPYATMDSKWEDPAYVELSPSFMSSKGSMEAAGSFQDGNVTNIPTPRTNKLMLESSLGSF